MNSPLFPVKDQPPTRTRTNPLITRDTPLQAAMDRLSIPALWTILNLPGKPGRRDASV